MKTIAIRLPDVGVAILLEVLKLDKASRDLRRLVRVNAAMFALNCEGQVSGLVFCAEPIAMLGFFC